MTCYRCLTCQGVHGWQPHPLLQPVRRHVRYPGEDVWYCPQCGQEHRTTDGTLLGQRVKRWEAVTLAEVEAAARADWWRRGDAPDEI